MQSDDRRVEWNRAYDAHQNALFWPNEHLVRFVATWLRRRLSLDEFVDVAPFDRQEPRLLDVGCGMGRHMAYAIDMRFEPYGIDVSDVAVAHAREWLRRLAVASADERAVVGNVTKLPWPSGFFDVAVSHAVLDSMPFVTATSAVIELHRVLRPRTRIYVDLIAHESGRAFEEPVTGPHETGTIQSYFDFEKIQDLLGSRFSIDACYLVTTDSIVGQRRSSRWHVTAQRNHA